MDALWIALVAKLVSTPQPAATVVNGTTLVCATFAEREARALGSYPKTHVAGCMTASGEILGAILTRQGVARCTGHGVLNWDTGCFVMQGCRTLSGCL